MKRYLPGLLLLVTAACTNYNEEELYSKANGVCQVGDVSLKADIRPILQRECYSCHASAIKTDGVDLENYNGLVQVAKDKLLPAINHEPGHPPMPQGSNKLPACDIARIQKWVDTGALNN
jgi:hypothetical protein